MTRLLITILFVVAIIIPILSNAVSSKEAATSGQKTTTAPCNCDNHAKGSKDCCCKKGVKCNCANCADCANKKDCKGDCANCPKKDCPKQKPVQKKGSCCPSHEDKK